MLRYICASERWPHLQVNTTATAISVTGAILRCERVGTIFIYRMQFTPKSRIRGAPRMKLDYRPEEMSERVTVKHPDGRVTYRVRVKIRSRQAETPEPRWTPFKPRYAFPKGTGRELFSSTPYILKML